MTSTLPGQAQLLRQFPVFASQGPPLHYLDNAATTQTPCAVIDAMRDYQCRGRGPVHRGLYPLAEAASFDYEDARRTVAGFIGSADASQLVFTRSATESINLVASGWLQSRLGPGDVVWVTRQEHHSNFLPWLRVCRQRGARLGIIELTEDGRLDLESAPELFESHTRLIALTLVSNVLGITNPVAELCREARAAGIPVLVDAAQAVAHRPLDVVALDCDFCAFSAHKMYGPDGIGALYARTERLAEMAPLLVGGGMVDRVLGETAEWLPAPAGLEAGSPNVTGAIGFAAAARWLSGLDREAGIAQLRRLGAYAITMLDELGRVTRYSPGDDAHIIAFNLAGVHPHDVAQVAAEHGVAVRAGHHCCQPLLAHLGTAATVRLSLGLYNSEADIDALGAALREALALFGGE